MHAWYAHFAILKGFGSLSLTVSSSTSLDCVCEYLNHSYLLNNNYLTICQVLNWWASIWIIWLVIWNLGVLDEVATSVWIEIFARINTLIHLLQQFICSFQAALQTRRQFSFEFTQLQVSQSLPQFCTHLDLVELQLTPAMIQNLLQALRWFFHHPWNAAFRRWSSLQVLLNDDTVADSFLHIILLWRTLQPERRNGNIHKDSPTWKDTRGCLLLLPPLSCKRTTELDGQPCQPLHTRLLLFRL